MPDFAKFYAAFRGSKGFLVGLVVFIGIWLSYHFTTGFDTEFGLLNTILSSEASVSLAFFTMLSDRQDRAQRKHAEALEHMVADIHQIGQATLAMAEAQRDVLKDHVGLLRAMREHDEQVLKVLTGSERA